MDFTDWMIPAAVAILASLAAGVTDVSRFKVYNKLTFPLAAAGLIYHAALHGWNGLSLSAAGLSVALAVLWIPYLGGALGAGDVKFFAAISAWLGLAPMFTILTSACIAAGVYSAVILTRRDGFRGLLRNFRTTSAELLTLGWASTQASTRSSVQEVSASDPNRRQRLVPFSAMLGIGVIAAVTCRALTVD